MHGSLQQGGEEKEEEEAVCCRERRKEQDGQRKDGGQEDLSSNCLQWSDEPPLMTPCSFQPRQLNKSSWKSKVTLWENQRVALTHSLLLSETERGSGRLISTCCTAFIAFLFNYTAG